MKMTTRRIDVTPDAKDFWRTQGHHFDSFTQAIDEFIDNAVANFLANSDLMDRRVTVALEEDGDNVNVRVEDTGTGISDFNVALRFADTSGQDGEPSEHGVGMKHALAYLNPENTNWRISTRTEDDVTKTQFRSVGSPYKFELDETTHADPGEWPGGSGGTGTVVEFQCSRHTLATVGKGSGGQLTQFPTMVAYLAEDLSFVYSGLIAEGKLTIAVQTDVVAHLPALEPKVDTPVEPKSGRVTAPWNPDLKLDYRFMRIHSHPDTKRRYKTKMSMSGVQLRLNGRVIEDNIFQDIWGGCPGHR